MHACFLGERPGVRLMGEQDRCRSFRPVAQSGAYATMRQGRAGIRGAFVQVESRMSQTGANADQWVPVKPGTMMMPPPMPSRPDSTPDRIDPIRAALKKSAVARPGDDGIRSCT